MINRVVLVGRLTKDPEIRYTGSNNLPVTSFTIAVSRSYINQQSGERDADFLPIVVWRKQAENAKRFLSKGSLVGVEGRIQTRSYDDNQGLKRFITEIIADNVYFLESKGQGEEDAQMKPQPSKDDEDFNYSDVSISEENDLPF